MASGRRQSYQEKLRDTRITNYYYKQYIAQDKLGRKGSRGDPSRPPCNSPSFNESFDYSLDVDPYPHGPYSPYINEDVTVVEVQEIGTMTDQEEKSGNRFRQWWKTVRNSSRNGMNHIRQSAVGFAGSIREVKMKPKCVTDGLSYIQNLIRRLRARNAGSQTDFNCVDEDDGDQIKPGAEGDNKSYVKIGFKVPEESRRCPAIICVCSCVYPNADLE